MRIPRPFTVYSARQSSVHRPRLFAQAQARELVAARLADTTGIRIVAGSLR